MTFPKLSPKITIAALAAGCTAIVAGQTYLAKLVPPHTCAAISITCLVIAAIGNRIADLLPAPKPTP